MSVQQQEYREAWLGVPGTGQRLPEARPGEAVGAATVEDSPITFEDSGIRAGSDDGPRGMDAFTVGLFRRIRATEADLSRARQAGVEFLAEVGEAERDDLRRLAAGGGARSRARRLFVRWPRVGRRRCGFRCVGCRALMHARAGGKTDAAGPRCGRTAAGRFLGAGREGVVGCSGPAGGCTHGVAGVLR